MDDVERSGRAGVLGLEKTNPLSMPGQLPFQRLFYFLFLKKKEKRKTSLSSMQLPVGPTTLSPTAPSLTRADRLGCCLKYGGGVEVDYLTLPPWVCLSVLALDF